MLCKCKIESENQLHFVFVIPVFRFTCPAGTPFLLACGVVPLVTFRDGAVGIILLIIPQMKKVFYELHNALIIKNNKQIDIS